MRDRIPALAALSLMASVGVAEACSRDPSEPRETREQQFGRASTVFVGHLMRTEEITAPTTLSAFANSAVVATSRTIEILKGRPPADGKVMSPAYGPGNCSVPLLAGSTYLFFLYDDNVVLLLGGSELFWNLDGIEPQKILSELRDLGKKAQ